MPGAKVPDPSSRGASLGRRNPPDGTSRAKVTGMDARINAECPEPRRLRAGCRRDNRRVGILPRRVVPRRVVVDRHASQRPCFGCGSLGFVRVKDRDLHVSQA